MTRAAVIALSLAIAGCGKRAPNATPEGAARELVDRMGHITGDPVESKRAFELLSKRAQANLAQRAQRYSAATGKAISPEAMIAPARFTLRFDPAHWRATIAGSYAIVDVTGASSSDRAQIPCVLEDGVWKVDLVIPPLPPVQVRPGSGP